MASLNDWRVIKRLGVSSLNGRFSHLNFTFSIPIVTWNVTNSFPLGDFQRQSWSHGVVWVEGRWSEVSTDWYLYCSFLFNSLEAQVGILKNSTSAESCNESGSVLENLLNSHRKPDLISHISKVIAVIEALKQFAHSRVGSRRDASEFVMSFNIIRVLFPYSPPQI